MPDMQKRLDEKARQERVYAAAMTSINGSKRGTERQGYTVIAAAMNYGEGALGSGWFGKISHGAQLFCIAFACAAPPLLVWYVLL